MELSTLQLQLIALVWALPLRYCLMLLTLPANIAAPVS
jgi:hypothetical protein